MIRYLPLVLSSIVLCCGGRAFATEAVPQFPMAMSFQFKGAPASYSVKVFAKPGKDVVEVYCNGRMMFRSPLEDLRHQKLPGSVVGVDLLEHDPGKCSRDIDLGLYVRDFSRDGGETIVYWDIGFVEGKVTTVGR